MKFTLKGRTGATVGAIEILADGEQYVVLGQHPKTGRPYQWFDGNQPGGPELLAAHDPRSLPVLSASIVGRHVYRAIAQVAARNGLEVETSGTGRRAEASDVEQGSLRAPSIELLREAVLLIPNDQHFAGRQVWLKQVFAIKAAAGPDHDAEGLEIAQEWSSGWEHPNDPAYVRDMWNTLKPPFVVGWNFLVEQAREHGFNSAALDFEATSCTPITTDTTPESARNEPQSTMEGVPEAPTPAIEHARIAALHGNRTRAFFLALPTLNDGELLERWNAMQKAADARDPLTEVFETVVLPAAKHLGVPADEPIRFDVMLEANLRDDPRWSSLRTR